MNNYQNHAKKYALVVEDRDTHLEIIKKVIEHQGYIVNTAMSLKAAKQKIIDMTASNERYELIVSDYDLGRKFWLKHRMFYGFFFLLWCIKRGISAKMILHSTAFEPECKIGLFMHRKSIIK